MPASNEAPRPEVLNYLAARFGVSPPTLAGTAFSESSDGEIWISSDAPAGLRAPRPPGLRAFRRTPSGLKPTSAFLVAIGPAVVSGRADVDAASLEQLLLGHRIPLGGDDGYVALAYDGYVVGCGAISDGILQSLIPTGRRRELLDIIARHAEPRSSEV